MHLIKFGLITVIALLVSACSHTTPVTEGDEANFCNFRRYSLNLDHRNNPTKNLSDIESLNAVLSKGFSADDSTAIPKDDMLFLSGGSLNGAFGAGVLQGWFEKDNTLPEFSVVTGVSTGALLSLAAFSNTPEAAVDGYTLEKESDAINAFVRRDKNGKIGTSSYLTALRKGALADISPLKDSTYTIAARHNLFPAIAKRGLENRKLLTGVVDIDTGEAIALDMTEMAIRIYQHNPSFFFNPDETVSELKKRNPQIGHYVDCFTSAIAASSSVPLAARPIAIDNRLYIDGGARFLVFSDVVGSVINPAVKFRPEESDKAISLYMIINGDQKITPKCGKKKCPKDLTGYNYWDVKGAREDWNMLKLVERTVDVLKTQVGEFSESEIRVQALELALKRQGIDIEDLYQQIGFFGLDDGAEVQTFTAQEQQQIESTVVNSFKNYKLFAIKIEPETLDHSYAGRTCSQWRTYDEKTDRNLQFHTNYMKCMISAGKDIMEQEGWN